MKQALEKNKVLAIHPMTFEHKIKAILFDEKVYNQMK